jgi:excisionase family DNA binding protein
MSTKYIQYQYIYCLGTNLYLLVASSYCVMIGINFSWYCLVLMIYDCWMAIWLDLEGLETYLRVPKSTLYHLVQRGSLPGHKIGRTWRFDQDEVDAWIKAGSSKPERATLGVRQYDEPAKPKTSS